MIGFIALICFGAVMYFIYLQLRVPDDVAPKSDAEVYNAWVVLGISIVSLISGVPGIVERIVKMVRGPSS